MQNLAVESVSPLPPRTTSSITPARASDEVLVRAAKQGQAHAFGELCERHHRKVYRTAYRIIRNHEDAEDAVQDSFIRAFMHLGEFDERAQFSTWLVRIAINSALMILRKKNQKRDVSLDQSDAEGKNEMPLQIPDARPDPEQHCLRTERRRMVRHAIGRLRPRVRRVIQISQLDECSVKETAYKLGISTSATKSLLLRGRASLRKMSVINAAGGGRRGRSANRIGV
jgi:RNA polymerase sigma factor (sigma-70 family)